MIELTVFLSNLSIFEKLKFIGEFADKYYFELPYMEDYQEIELPENYKKIIDKYSIEQLICILSNMLDDETIKQFNLQDLNKIASKFIITELEHNNFPINRNSIILDNLEPIKEFLVYEGYINDKNFYQKYGHHEKFSCLVDKEIARLLFKKEFMDDFLMMENHEIDNYGRKHHMINIFFSSWTIYKHKVEVDSKERFLNVIKNEFSHVNWKTVSRLFDVEDAEFIQTFLEKIDWEFAKEYHSKLKKK